MKFSIIITGYNQEKHVVECVNSCLDQTYGDIEILVYNDNSTDQTGQILNNYGSLIKVVHSDQNMGAAYGRKVLSNMASGDVLCFVDMDDYLVRNAISIVRKHYRKGIKATYGSYVTPEGVYVEATPYPDEVWKNHSFRTAKWRATHLRTFRRELVLSVDDQNLQMNGQWLKICTDLALSFPILERLKSHEVAVIKKPIYVYRAAPINKDHARAYRTKIRSHLSKQSPMKVICSLATFGPRRHNLAKTLQSLENQTVKPSQIHVYDNELFPDLTDNGKFFPLQFYREPVIFFSMDDDIIYPPDYIEYTLCALQNHPGCIVTYHGRELNRKGVPYYQKGNHRRIACAYEYAKNHVIDVPGTGVTAFRTDTFNPSEIWKSKDLRMSDLVFAYEASKQKVPVMALAHPGDWIKIQSYDTSSAIWENEVKNDSRQTWYADAIIDNKNK